MTNKPEPRAIRYLLGDLPESEQVAVEREFFSDPAVFERLVQAETALVDDYVRHRLSPRLRKQFEQYYLAHPSRRERAGFADALATKIDEMQSTAPLEQTDRRTSVWQDVLLGLGRGWVMRVSMAAIAAVLLLTTGWLFVQTGLLRRDLIQTEMARQAAEQHELDLQRQLSTARAQAPESAHEPQPSRTAPPPAVVSLFLSVGSIRGTATGPAPTLVIPPQARQVRIEFALGQHDYASYRVALKPIAGPDVFTRQHLNPQRTKSGPSLVLTVPADRLPAGDYILAVSGENASTELDEIARSLFRVEKK